MMILIHFHWPKTNPVRRIKEKTHTRLRKSVPVLDPYTHLYLDPQKLRIIRRKRNICSKVGHMWEIHHIVFNGDKPYLYYVECSRCFPHIHSRREVVAYNLFEPSQKEQI